jgi:hypothetical protein
MSLESKFKKLSPEFDLEAGKSKINVPSPRLIHCSSVLTVHKVVKENSQCKLSKKMEDEHSYLK